MCLFVKLCNAWTDAVDAATDAMSGTTAQVRNHAIDLASKLPSHILSPSSRPLELLWQVLRVQSLTRVLIYTRFLLLMNTLVLHLCFCTFLNVTNPLSFLIHIVVGGMSWIVCAVWVRPKVRKRWRLHSRDARWGTTRNQYNSQSLSSCHIFHNNCQGGQYTNLLYQSSQLGLTGQWSQVKAAYATANRLLGDIIKVTPSSKVTGDLAQVSDWCYFALGSHRGWMTN